MFQKFYTDTIVGRFIKHLLSVENIPLLNVVQDGDVLIKDCLYIYRNLVIQCAETGKLAVNQFDKLYPSDNLYPSVVLFPDKGEKSAKFKVVSYYSSKKDRRYNYSYMSTENYYDSKTHQYLGEYLRYIRNSIGLDLLPFYNCNSQQYIENIRLRKDSAKVTLYPGDNLYPSEFLHPGYNVSTISTYEKIESSGNYKVLSIPIKFNKTYTVAVECNTDVVLRSVILSSDNHLIKNTKGDSYLSDKLESSYMYKASTRFDQPFVYNVSTTDKNLYSHEKNLRLLLQLPLSNKSSVVVLEGNYTQLDILHTDKNSTRTYNTLKNLSLLQSNTFESYAFSDRLVEYLLLNVICKNEELTENISRSQNALKEIDEEYSKIYSKNCSDGVWDDYMFNATQRFIEECSKDYYLLDQDGNINKDIESLFVLKTNGSYDV